MTDDDRAAVVVTRLDDVTADLVIAELNERSVPVVRLDPGDFPTAVTLDVYLGAQGPDGRIVTSTRSIDVSRVRSVYWRRPSPYAAPPGVTGGEARWCADQIRYGLGGLLGALPGAHYVNHPWRNRDAEHKPAQLATAARSGLRIPPTLITNDRDRACRFAAEHGPVVYKPLWNTDYVDAEGRHLNIWAAEADPAGITAQLYMAPHLFQKRVDKTSDVRLTAVGGKLFGVRIDGAPGLDWRLHYDRLAYAPIDPPPDVTKAVHAYLDAFGLVFGAFDFGLDQEGRWWFYECNPNGQWAWFPAPITKQITCALADRLQHPGERP
ncbi:ATP-grasp ribosomal peptide maturase [Streptomyces olivoreticuli]|uniref:ATP-grasp ribosomal peptide maturase n=1 Tax=Streptomyces olivoreticuli TaxID=68246 RepID=UPI0026592C9D|nr:ATP-grasp ribosomal peptide maturase [Streptomyces olivoreticuli]WKK21307.1 ATP-grasp ribosomal peptide maturase [Streptomyces olivoreticuli]